MAQKFNNIITLQCAGCPRIITAATVENIVLSAIVEKTKWTYLNRLGGYICPACRKKVDDIKTTANVAIDNLFSITITP